MTQRRETQPGEVCLLDAFPQLTAELETAEAERARGELMVRVERVPAGAWRPPASPAAGPIDLGLLLIDGLLARHVLVADTRATELIGRGDLLRPSDHEGEDAPVPFGVAWTGPEPLTVAVLVAGVTEAAGRWPQLVVAAVRGAGSCTASRRSGCRRRTRAQPSSVPKASCILVALRPKNSTLEN